MYWVLLQILDKLILGLRILRSCKTINLVLTPALLVDQVGYTV